MLQSEMKLLLRQYCDDPQGDRLTDEVCRIMLNASIENLYAEMLDKESSYIPALTYELTFSADNTEVILPADFQKIKIIVDNYKEPIRQYDRRVAHSDVADPGVYIENLLKTSATAPSSATFIYGSNVYPINNKVYNFYFSFLESIGIESYSVKVTGPPTGIILGEARLEFTVNHASGRIINKARAYLNYTDNIDGPFGLWKELTTTDWVQNATNINMVNLDMSLASLQNVDINIKPFFVDQKVALTYLGWYRRPASTGTLYYYPKKQQFIDTSDNYLITCIPDLFHKLIVYEAATELIGSERAIERFWYTRYQEQKTLLLHSSQRDTMLQHVVLDEY